LVASSVGLLFQSFTMEYLTISMNVEKEIEGPNNISGCLCVYSNQPTC